MNKINTFFKKHKTKVIVYSSIFIVVLIISNILLNSAYSFVVSEYEKDPTCIQTCEDGINTLRKMKYYRNSNITFDLKNIDDSFERVLTESHLRFIKKNPNSLARVYIYFDRKNYEVHYTTKIIEQTRYKYTQI